MQAVLPSEVLTYLPKNCWPLHISKDLYLHFQSPHIDRETGRNIIPLCPSKFTKCANIIVNERNKSITANTCSCSSNVVITINTFSLQWTHRPLVIMLRVSQLIVTDQCIWQTSHSVTDVISLITTRCCFVIYLRQYPRGL